MISRVAHLPRQEFKIYNSDNDTWYPPNANSWFIHSGGRDLPDQYGEFPGRGGGRLSRSPAHQATSTVSTPTFRFRNGQYGRNQLVLYTVPNAARIPGNTVCGGFLDSGSPATASAMSTHQLEHNHYVGQRAIACNLRPEPATGRGNLPQPSHWNLPGAARVSLVILATPALPRTGRPGWRREV